MELGVSQQHYLALVGELSHFTVYTLHYGLALDFFQLSSESSIVPGINAAIRLEGLNVLQSYV